MTQYWEPGTQYNYGDVVLYEGHRYKIIQPHRSQGDWAPPITPALWGRLQDYDEGPKQQHYNQPSYEHQGQPQQSWKPERKEESKLDQAKNWAQEHEHELKIAGGVVGAAAVAAGATAAYKHYQGKADSQQNPKPEKVESKPEGKSWFQEHEQGLKIAGGLTAAAVTAAGATAAYKYYQGKEEKDDNDSDKEQEGPGFVDQAKDWAHEHKDGLKIGAGVAAGAAALAGGAVLYNKYQGKEKEEHQQENRPQQNPQAAGEQSWFQENKKPIMIGAGVLAGAAAVAGGVALYKHHEEEEEREKAKKQQERFDHKAEITHLEEKAGRLHLDDERAKHLKIAGGVVAGAAAAGGGYALYKAHEKSEEREKQFARNRESWLKEAEERTRDLYTHGPRGPATWVIARGSNIPQGAIQVSKENDWFLHICRAFHDGGIQLGKASESFPQGGVIGYRHEEIHVDTYEILLGNMNGLRWVPARGYLNPASLGYKPVEGGFENDGTRLYIAQAEYSGVFHPGKASEKLDGAYIPWGGTEKNVKEYRVLCYNM